MNVVPKSRILGTGHYTPERVVSNVDLEKVVDTSDSWITERTGIRRRHYAADDEVTSDMATAAARRALEAAGLNVADLDMIIVGTISGDTPMPAFPGAAHVRGEVLVRPRIERFADGTFVAVLDLRREAGLGALPAAMWGLGRLVLRLARLGVGYDLLYANTQKAFVASALAGLLARRPVVWHLRDILSAEHFSPSLLALVRRLARLPHVHVIANSDATAQALLALGGEPRRLVTIHNGIDPEPWAPVDPSRLMRLRTRRTTRRTTTRRREGEGKSTNEQNKETNRNFHRANSDSTTTTTTTKATSSGAPRQTCP